MNDLYITGLGVCSSIGTGKADFTDALLQGKHRFAYLQRPGRQCPEKIAAADSGTANTGAKNTSTTDDVLLPFIGAEIEHLVLPESISKSLLRTCSFSAQAALACVHEAWLDAGLDTLEPERIGLIVGGSNVQQRELVQTQAHFRDRLEFVRPTYAMSFMDSDICGLCTEVFQIRGLAYTCGGASASGLLSVLQAIQAVDTGLVDACIAVGALMDISYWECLGFRALGAMGSDRFRNNPAAACRPFDREHDGFIFGENCSAVVITRGQTVPAASRYAHVAGWGMSIAANRNPNPSLEDEVAVIEQALQRAECSARDIDYVNPHGTGSALGDNTELKALKACGLNHARLNTTKSIIGHGLSAAGNIELVATLLQMQQGQLHPSRNLQQPIDCEFEWVGNKGCVHPIQKALKLSYGFGGINTALCIHRIE